MPKSPSLADPVIPASDPNWTRPATISRGSALPLTARLVMRRLDRLSRGSLRITLPDGSHQVCGNGGHGLDAGLDVHRWRFFARLAASGDIGAGEAYVDGDWDTDDLVTLTRFFLANEDDIVPSGLVGLVEGMRNRIAHALNRNNRAGARRNIRAHYDIGNEFYALFLDPSMTYSAAVFENPSEKLLDAQTRKYRRISDAAGIREGDHVLEIGCGWGGFAEFAATHLDCRVTGITLSSEQAEFARARLKRQGLLDRVEIQIIDYRDLAGRFDAIVSIEMLEAVGHRYLGDYFRAIERLLRPGGRAALQTITIPDQFYDRYRKGSDWIRKYIFPGGHLPSLGSIQSSLARHTRLSIDRARNIGPHYATTLNRWRQRFWRNEEGIRSLGFDTRFMRMWDFYLATCEATFAHRHLGNHQLALARIGEDRVGTQR